MDAPASATVQEPTVWEANTEPLDKVDKNNEAVAEPEVIPKTSSFGEQYEKEFQNMKLRDLYEITLDENFCIDWLQDLGLLFKERTCDVPSCGKPMKRNKKSAKAADFMWKCSDRKCGRLCGFRRGTFFERSNLSISQIFEFTYFWARDNLKPDEMRYQIGRDKKELHFRTFLQWRYTCRAICAQHLLKHSDRIGGNGMHVEIDACLLISLKHDVVDSVSNEQWAFAGVEAASKKCFLVSVPDRTIDTLKLVLLEYILPGSLVTSELWQSYCLSNLGPVHFTVTNFKGRIWKKAKDQYRQSGKDEELLNTFMPEFLWRRKYKDNLFYNLWKHISEEYPCC